MPVALGVISLVAWFIRLEQKVNSMEKAGAKCEQLVEDTWKDLEQHRTNEGVHFNQRLANEVEHRQSDRMSRMESDLHEIKTMVKGLTGK